MSVCLIALIIFGILGIFSAGYRRKAKMLFRCVIDNLRLRPCQMAYDKKIRAKIAIKIGSKNNKLGRFTYKYFKAISWVFVILFFGSMIFTAYTIYNLTTYGSCDPHSTECIFNPGTITCDSLDCAENGCDCTDTGCAEDNNFAACEGNCDCKPGTCGE